MSFFYFRKYRITDAYVEAKNILRHFPEEYIAGFTEAAKHTKEKVFFLFIFKETKIKYVIDIFH